MMLPMEAADSLVRETVVRELMSASALSAVTISAEGQGFALRFRLGNGTKTLATSRGKVRLFASLDTAASFVSEIGLNQFEVDMTGHKPGRLRKARPDRAQALRLTRTRMQQEPLSFLRQ